MSIDDEPEELQCPDCDFRFSVVWQLDFERSSQCLKDGDTVINYCPFCGEEMNL